MPRSSSGTVSRTTEHLSSDAQCVVRPALSRNRSPGCRNDLLPSQRSHDGFSLVELLMVIAICNILLALLFPAVQAARESANRVQCANHLKQIGLAWHMHHDAHQHLPTGGWGWQWTGDPDRGYAGRQPGAWAYNILPYVEEEAVHNIGAGMSDSDKTTANVERLSRTISTFNCPTRRAVALYTDVWHPAATNCEFLPAVARGDYAASVGNPRAPIDPAHCDPGAQTYCQCNGGPPSLAAADNGSWSNWAVWNALNGVSFQRSTVAFRQITDGMSYTTMVGEKYINPLEYATGLFGGDNESLYVGFDDDVYRTTGFGPLQDAVTNSDLFRFGSAHAAAFNMVFCDGSVRQINYEIDDFLFMDLGSRSGGEVIDASAF
jgi:prepilin-type N-terminal cleavage/methylation domain-containing protein/prepilin-type processing-associated H-X9-DG protein